MRKLLQQVGHAVHEVAFHMGRFYAATNDPAHDETFRSYTGRLNKTMHDLTKGKWPELLDPDPKNYATPQALARKLRTEGSNGLIYPSVRFADGKCLAAFWPDVVSIPVQAKHITLRWDGKKIAEWSDHATSETKRLVA